jgi:hypothetical protein
MHKIIVFALSCVLSSKSIISRSGIFTLGRPGQGFLLLQSKYIKSDAIFGDSNIL